MAEMSEGWDGSVNEAAIARILAAASGPRIDNGFLVEPLAGQRRLILSAGESHQAFIRYADDASRNIYIDPPGAGGRWQLLVQRRDWANNVVTTLLLPADETTPADAPGLPPASYPDGYIDVPGVAVDLPLYWVWSNATNTNVTHRRIPLDRTPRNALAEWGVKVGPLEHVGAPDGPHAVRWDRGHDSGGTINAVDDPIGIMIGEDGIYEAIARQRVNGMSSASSYTVLAINGARSAISIRDGGAWFHDHGSDSTTSSQSTYLGPLYRGELLTMGPPANSGGGMTYGSAGLNGTLLLRRIS